MLDSVSYFHTSTKIFETDCVAIAHDDTVLCQHLVFLVVYTLWKEDGITTIETPNGNRGVGRLLKYYTAQHSTGKWRGIRMNGNSFSSPVWTSLGTLD